jgi:FAD synthetase
MVKLQPDKTTILIFGTFDMVHPGHEHLFKQARALAKKGTEAFLIVSLARDKNVARIKGKKPRFTETQRLAKVKAIPEVDRVLLGALGDHIPPIVKINPDVIALGYDQQAYVKGLRIALKNAGINPKIVRLKPHKPHLYKTSLLQK